MKGCYVKFLLLFYFFGASAAINVSADSREVVDSASATFTVSCAIDALSGQVDTVVWKLGDTVLTDDSTYTPDVGTASYSSGAGAGTQTTTLEVSGSDTTRSNMQFTCVVTDPSDGTTTKQATVYLKFYTVTSVTKSVTTAVDQTLTCTIGGLTANGAAATVVWKDPDNNTVDDDGDYDISNGTPGGSGNQSAELTIKAAKLTSVFASQSSFTYKCSVKSALYPKSPTSSDVDVEANVIKLAVTAVNKEQLTGTVATISCTVSGLTRKLDGVKWAKSDNTTITSDQDGYTIDDGSLNGDSQITILTVGADQNNIDTTYKCLITSSEHDETDKSTTVNLKVFTVTSTLKSLTTDVDQTLTCTIGELDASGTPATVSWKDPDGAAVLKSDTTNYELKQGAVTSEGTQSAELVIKRAKLAAFTDQDSFTYKCSVKSSQYTDSPASADVDVVANVVKQVCTNDADCTDGTCNGSNVCECNEADGYKLNDDNLNLCEKVTCSADYCSNNGVCSVEGIELECDCMVGTAGDTCANFTSDPCTANPCKNGGACSRDMSDPSDYTKHTCSCTDGFTGENCEDSSDDDSDGKDSDRKRIPVEAIVGGTVGGVILVLGAAIFAFAIFKKTTARVAVATVEVTFEGTGDGTIHTNPANEV